ncbi:MAG TPA: anthranilate phosphoribosyltransferase [Chloroflexia bacterium]|nr:anthranilate phosphoribosyltransferase [Chloroflexia bacterium]
MIKEAISRLVNGQHLNREEAAAAMEEIMEGEASPVQIGSFLTALRIKGETIEELAGLASVMRAKATQVEIPPDLNRPVVDTCGTGGDGANTFNISTTAAFVVAGAGAAVAKHGNRAASSRCGSADVLEALGVNINLKPEQVTACLQEAGIGFMFAPLFHPSMKYVGPVRREIGIRTVFNYLGPLTNPAGAHRQVLGVPSQGLAALIAPVSQQLGSEHTLVVHSADGLDEVSIASETYIYEVKEGDTEIQRTVVRPEDFGLQRCPASVMQGGNAEDNRAITLEVLEGERAPQRDVVLLNSAAALVAAGLAKDFQQGIEQAARSIDSGAARRSLNALVRVSQSFA